MSMVEIRYQCLCGINRILFLPARRDDEPLPEWLRMVCQPAVYIDHRTHSPDCRAKAPEYVEFHQDDIDEMGKPETQQ